MDWQHLFDVAMTFVLGIGGYVIRGLDGDIKNLEKQDEKIASDITEIKVLVAGNYVKKEEFDKVITRLFEKLDHIEEKISNKADK